MKTEYQREGFELVLERYLGISNSPGSELLMPMDARVAFCGDGFLRIYTPKKVEWNGEGLPPVGIECMTLSSGRERRIEVLGVGKTRLLGRDVETGEEFGFSMINRTFYPIRTPEQIAAEEREREFEEIRSVIGRNPDIRDAAEELLARGYRKQVKP